jgi:acetyl/propionyl-CoA carboxylase alpha subunit
VDDGFTEGMDIPIYYDPMLAKLVAHGATRAEAIQKILGAIANFEIEGCATTLDFGRFVFEHPAFLSGDFDTHFVQNYFTPEILVESAKKEAEIAAEFALAMYLEDKKLLRVPNVLASDWAGR